MKKILVIDDEADILNVVKLILSGHGFKVKTLSNWQHITQAIESFAPDLILLDVLLSGGDGRDICNQLKNTKETEQIPVILFSANYNLLNTLNGAKPNAILKKPFELKELINIVSGNLN